MGGEFVATNQERGQIWVTCTVYWRCHVSNQFSFNGDQDKRAGNRLVGGRPVNQLAYWPNCLYWTDA